MNNKSQQVILVVEDSPEDYHMIVRGFEKSGLINPLVRCEDGDEALDYLFRRGQYSDPASSPRPGIILLDLNLPGTDGREVLKEIKKSPELKVIPVVVLTTSSNPDDIEKCYKYGANSYMCKPVGISKFFEAIERLNDYWFEITILPRRVS